VEPRKEEELHGICGTGEGMRDEHKILGNLKGRDHLGGLGVDGGVIPEWILDKYFVYYCHNYKVKALIIIL
jgi:hypothetical protein